LKSKVNVPPLTWTCEIMLTERKGESIKARTTM